jgi:hypothetical protein
MYIVTRSGLLWLFRLPELHRLAVDSLPSLSEQLDLAGALSTPSIPAVKLPSSFDGFTSCHLLLDPSSAGLPPSGMTVGERGIPLRIQFGLLLCDARRSMYRCHLSIDLHAPALERARRGLNMQLVWRNLGQCSNALVTH